MVRGANHDLHGNAPDSSPVALVLIDLINDLEFKNGAALLRPALAAARRIVALKARARRAGVPVIYANDNFGRWRSDFREVVDHCLADGVRGRPLAELVRPEPEDYFVLKPKPSAFFATTLQTLLEYLGVRRVILTGVSTEHCVLFTAQDAYLRDLELHVPADCVASASPASRARALAFMRQILKADMRPSTRIDLRAMRRHAARAR